MIKQTITSILFLSLAVTASQPAMAQNQFSLGELQPGQLMLNLSTTEQRSVEQDSLTASLEFIVQGRDRNQIQNELNTTMAKALMLLEDQEAFEFQTSGYQVFIVETARPTKTDITNPVWRARQSVELSGTDSTRILETTAKLQNLGLTLTSLYYSLSVARYEEVAGQLLEQALAKLQGRAETAASALGKASASLVEVSMDGSPNFGGYRERGAVFAMAADSSMSPPVADPGETTVSVSISARAVVCP